MTKEELPEVNLQRITPAELKAKMDGKEEFILLDVRNAIDTQKLWIDYPNRLAITLDDLPSHLSEVPQGKQIVLIDVNGKRSPIAGRYIHGKGFTDVLMVSGGMQQWAMEGQQTVFGK